MGQFRLFLFVCLVITSFQIRAEDDSLEDKDVVQEARYTVRVLQDRRDRLKENDTKEILSLLERIQKIALVGNTGDAVCVESVDQPGKACFKALSGDNLCLGNYFSNLESCKSSLRVMRYGVACYESRKQAGKAIVAKVEKVTTGISQNYFDSLPVCNEALEASRDNLICMQSVRQAGKWFVGDLDKDGEMRGPYFSSLAECAAGLQR